MKSLVGHISLVLFGWVDAIILLAPQNVEMCQSHRRDEILSFISNMPTQGTNSPCSTSLAMMGMWLG